MSDTPVPAPTVPDAPDAPTRIMLARRGQKADATERPKDVEPDDDEFTTWTPNVKAPPAQFDERACRLALPRDASLVDTTKASTPVERAINVFPMGKPPKGGAEPEPPGELTRITGVGFRVQGDRDGAIIGRVSDWLRKRIFSLRVESWNRNGQAKIELAEGVTVNRKRVGAAGMFLYGPNGGRLSDHC